MAQNTPPPYENITGISRVIMKDNAQETLAGYNGSARPGELVVNLEVDPPTIFVGNNSGQLTQLVSGGGGGGGGDTADITFTGTTISTANDEQRIQIQTRDEDGEWNTRITMDPEDVYIRMEVRNGDTVSRIDLDQVDNERITIEGRDIDMVVDIDDDISIDSGDDIDITAADRMRMTGERVVIRSNGSESNVNIITDNNDTQQTWEFRPNGVVKMPGATVQGTNTATDTGSAVALDVSKSIHKLADGDYTLADGEEGQIIYIVPQTGATHTGVELVIANARVMTNSQTSQVVNDNLFLPFSSSTASSLTNVVTLIFTDGAWNLSGGEWD